MRRDEMIASVAIRANSLVVWIHESGRGWSKKPFSPDALDAMSNSELEDCMARLSRSLEDRTELARQLFPDLDDSEVAQVVRENLEEEILAVCASCGQPIQLPGPAYLSWDAPRQKWVAYCASHKPAEYWREWPGGRRPPGAADAL